MREEIEEKIEELELSAERLIKQSKDIDLSIESINFHINSLVEELENC